MRAPRPKEAAAALCLGLALAAGRVTAVDALAVDPADPRLAARSDLLGRLTASAHGYFRFVNAAFAGETCRLFSDVGTEAAWGAFREKAGKATGTAQ